MAYCMVSGAIRLAIVSIYSVNHTVHHCVCTVAVDLDLMNSTKMLVVLPSSRHAALQPGGSADFVATEAVRDSYCFR